MVRRFYRIVFTLLILGLAWSGVPHSGLAGISQRPDSKKPEQSKKSLEELHQRLDRIQRKKVETAKQERSLLKQLEMLDQELHIQQKEFLDIEAKIGRKDREVQELLAQMDPLQESVLSQRALVRKRLESMYKEGRAPYIKILAGSSDYHDFLKRTLYLQRVVEKEAEMLTGYEESVRDLQERSMQIERMKDSLVGDRNELKAKLNEIEDQKSRKNVLLASIRDEKSSYDQAIGELEDASQRLQALIREMERQRQSVRLPSGEVLERASPKGILTSQGKLNWPADGVLVSRFGLQKHPRFDTYVFRKGIEIGSYEGGGIRSVFDGQVVYADWFPGYGMVIIMDHGENYFGLYAHLSKLLVSVGDIVRKDQIIGEMGSTGLSEGNRLYFEMRQGGQPVDPMTWLKVKP